MLTWAHFVMVGATAMVVLAAVLLHYEVCSQLNHRLYTSRLRQRSRMVMLILGLMVAHFIEIWLFGIGAWLLTRWPEMGAISVGQDAGLLEFVYLSATSFTTLGYGDVVPHGVVRFLFGVEAVTGFAIITWSASYTFLDMQRQWSSNI
ncbi:ion channel [Marinobacteraceae bacterium S3BR75-40.1]